MGTRFECVLFGRDQTRLRAAAEASFAEIESLSARWSYFASGSLVSRINREAAERPVALDAETRDILRLALNTWRDTRGCFDITIAPLMRRWGLRDVPPRKPLGASSVPTDRFNANLTEDSEQSSVARDVGSESPPVWSSQHVLLDDAACTLAFAHPGIEIDLGAIAKGWAIDRAAEALREAGVEAALLHGGTSSVIAIGSPAHSPRGWPVRLGPFDDSPVVHLRDIALGISAPHGRTATVGGQLVGHVIDPRTGAPAGWIGETPCESVRASTPDLSLRRSGSIAHAPETHAPPVAGEHKEPAKFAACVHASAAIADAWSTALLVRGSPRGLTLPPSLAAAIRLADTWTFTDSFPQHLSPEPAS